MTIPVEPVIAVSGAWVGASSAAGVTVCSAQHLRHVVHGPLTLALFDHTDVAVIANAVARALPDATRAAQ